MTLRRGSLISRAAALAVLALLLLAGHRLIVMPVMDRYAENARQIAHRNELLQRYRRLAAMQPELAERFEQSGGQAGSGIPYWDAESDALAIATLQDHASETIAIHGGEVVSMQAVDADEPVDVPPLRRTMLTLRLSATTNQLATILHEMETAEPYLFVDRLMVTSGRSRTGGNRFGKEDDARDPTLDVRMDVFGYVRNRALEANGDG